MRETGRSFDTSLLGQFMRGIAVDIAVAAGVGIVLVLIVALAGTMLVAPPDQGTAPQVIPKVLDEEGEDLDPRDPLVLCTLFIDHTSCAREPT